MTFRLVTSFVLLCLILNAPAKQTYAYFSEVISGQSIPLSHLTTLARCHQHFSSSLQPKQSLPTETSDYLIESLGLTLEKDKEEKEEYITEDPEELRRILEQLLMQGAENISFYIDSDGYLHIIASPSFYFSEEKNAVSTQLIPEEKKPCQNHLGHCPTSLLVVTNDKERYNSTSSGLEDNNGGKTEGNSDDSSSDSDQNSQEETDDSSGDNDSGNQSADPDEGVTITIRYAKYWFNQYCNIHKLDPEKTNPKQLLKTMLEGKAKKSEGGGHYETKDYLQFISSLLLNLGEYTLVLQVEGDLLQDSSIDNSASLFLLHLWIGYLDKFLTLQKLYDKDRAIAKWFAEHFGSENIVENVAKIMLRGTAMGYSATEDFKEAELVMRLKSEKESAAQEALSEEIGNKSSTRKKKRIKRKHWNESEDEEFSRPLAVTPPPRKMANRKGGDQPLPQ